MTSITSPARTLHDSDTGELIGTATPAQIDASDGAGDTGHILIDADGDVVTVGTWAAQQPGVHRVYVGVAAPLARHTATVTTDAGNTAIVDIASHATNELAGIGPVEGSIPDADLIAFKLSGREFGSWTTSTKQSPTSSPTTPACSGSGCLPPRSADIPVG